MKTSGPPRFGTFLWIAMAVALAFLLPIQLPRIANPLAIEEDFRNYHWIHRYRNAELFPDESLDWRVVIEVETGSGLLMWESSSPGYSLLFRIATLVTNPVLFSKLLAFPLMLLAVYYAYRIGEHLAGRGVGLALSLVFIVLNLASSTEISIVGGLHRSFSMPIILGLVYYLMQRRLAAAALFVFLSGTIYVPIFPICALTYALSCMSLREDGRWRLRVQWRNLLPLLVAVLLVMIAVSPMLANLQQSQQSVTGRTSGPGGVLSDPSRQPGGRGQLFTLFPFIGPGGITNSGEDAFHLLILGILAVLTWLIRRSRTTLPPPVFVKLLYASLTGFAAAWLAALATGTFLLHLPSRHTRASLFLILLIFLVINAKETLREGATWITANRQRLIWYILPVSLAAVSLALFLPDATGRNAAIFRGPAIRIVMVGLTAVFVLLAALAARRARSSGGELPPAEFRLPSRGTLILLGLALALTSLLYINWIQPTFHSPPASSQSLFAFLETLPLDARIAGNPCNLDDIAFYARRSVLLSCERFPPDDELVIDALKAYYSESGREITDFCRRYGVDYLVVNEKTFTQEFLAAEKYFYEPYNSTLRPIVASRSQFALNEISEDSRLFQVDDIFVVSCSPDTFG